MDDDDSRIIIDDTCLSSECQIDETQIKQYKKERLLGVGSFGKAYLVTSDDENNTKYVMKVLALSTQAKQEAQILQNLRHENIIQYVEAFIDNKNRLCLIMEYANNGTLGEYLKSRTQPLPETQIIDWFTQLCLALQCVHSSKIIHRDIKADNVFLNDDQIKLGDFGIARSVEQTLAKTFIGTPYYISPEIISNQPYSYKSDVWSLGVLLYEMCTFKYPFIAENLPALATKIMKGKIQPISAQLYSQNMKNLIQQLLLIDQNKRPSIEQILQNSLIQNRIKQINIQQQQIVKIPVQPMQKKQLHKVVIKKDEYTQLKKQSREEQQKFMREDIQKKKGQQKPQEVVIELFGQPKTKKDVQPQQQQVEKKQSKKKQRDIPVEIYLPFMQKYEQTEPEQQPNSVKENIQQNEQAQNQENNEKVVENDNKIQVADSKGNEEKQQVQKKKEVKQVPQETQVAQKPVIKLSYEKAEKLRLTLEQAFGDDYFEVYNKFKTLRENSSVDEIARKYGPTYQELLPSVNLQTIQDFLSYLFILIEFDLDQ